MSKPKLHLDEDTSNPDLYRSLISKGHDVTHTPNEWIKKKASDEEQLKSATKHGRTLFTFNTRHFAPLAKRIFKHAGIILSPQKPISVITKALNRFFNESSAEEVEDQVRWLSDWEK